MHLFLCITVLAVQSPVTHMRIQSISEQWHLPYESDREIVSEIISVAKRLRSLCIVVTPSLISCIEMQRPVFKRIEFHATDITP